MRCKRATAICLGAVMMLAGTVQAATYHEAPMLTELVKAGKLPAVEERLPEDPYVQSVVEEIGKYGGTMKRAWRGISDKWGTAKLGEEFFLRFSADGSKLVPNLASSFEVLDNAKTFVFHLRKGIKWSDGEPFTADDVIFHWKYIRNNKEIYPSLPWWIKSPGTDEAATVEKLDEYTFKISFSQPFPRFPEMFTYEGKEFYSPAHWFKKVLPEFVGEEVTKKIAADSGYANAKDYLQWHAKYYWVFSEVPSLRAWNPISDPSDTTYVMERNPYYWKVDQEGNQLPYIDRITHDLIEDREVINLKAVAGELDFQGRHIRIENFPLFMESREKGDYRVLRIKKGDGSKVTFNPNLTCKEPVLRQLFADDRFRKALSVAIDRDEINEIVFQGLGTPRQASIIEGGAFYSEEWANAYTEYDPDKAATLLDEIGLKWDNEKKYRLRPDGQVLAVTIESREGKTEETTSELVKSYWEEIGVKTAVKIEDRSLFESRRDGNDMEIALWDYSAFNFLLDPLQMVPVRHQYYWYGTYGLWNEMNGAQGEKPTGDVARLLELWSVILSAQTTEERDAAAEEIVKLHTKNIWSIGTVGQNPSLFIVKNNLRNVPQEGVIDDDVLRTPGNLDPWQFFFK